MTLMTNSHLGTYRICAAVVLLVSWFNIGVVAGFVQRCGRLRMQVSAVRYPGTPAIRLQLGVIA